jgi:hypothetical protein
MKTKIMSLVLTALVYFSIPPQVVSGVDQSEDDSTSGLQYNFNADLVNRYIWRGIPQSLNPNIQPYAWIDYKNFSFGAWASYGISQPYAEVDLYLSYTAGLFTFTINDYFNQDEEDLSLTDYFQYAEKDSSDTPHILEGAITFNGTENIPLSLTAATFFYGCDKDTVGDNYYSTYLELAYGFKIGNNELSIFAGGTLAEGYYADKAAFINVGLKAVREIPISEKFSMPVSMALIINPNAKNIFFVFGITF